jgi:AcrR family transcriptional regulator
VSSTLAEASDREAIVRAAVSALRRHAFHELDFLALSQDSGIPVGTLQRSYPSWSDLVIAVLERWTTERLRPLSSGSGASTAPDLLRAMVVSNLHDPVLVHLFIAVAASTSAVPDHPLAEYIRRRTATFRARLAQVMVADIAAGNAPSTLDAEEAAGDMMQLFDGLQVQSLLRPEMDLLVTLDRWIDALCASWERTGSAAVASGDGAAATN